MTEDYTQEFWLEVKETFDVRTTVEVEEFIHLLSFVNSLEPRENWIVPLLKDVPFKDFRSQFHSR